MCYFSVEVRELHASRANSRSKLTSTVPRQKFTARPVILRFQLIILPHHFAMPRAPLTPISGNRPRKSELAPYERGMIVGAQALGHTPTEFEKPLNFIKSTIVRPLPVPELLVKSDGTYRATLWLRNPRPSRRLHN